MYPELPVNLLTPLTETRKLECVDPLCNPEHPPSALSSLYADGAAIVFTYFFRAEGYSSGNPQFSGMLEKRRDSVDETNLVPKQRRRLNRLDENCSCGTSLPRNNVTKFDVAKIVNRYQAPNCELDVNYSSKCTDLGKPNYQDENEFDSKTGKNLQIGKLYCRKEESWAEIMRKQSALRDWREAVNAVRSAANAYRMKLMDDEIYCETEERSTQTVQQSSTLPDWRESSDSLTKAAIAYR